MADKTKSSSKPIVDVAHPNKSAPAQNSKSVIVSNRPMLKDPMVVDQEDPEITASDKSQPPAKSVDKVSTTTREEQTIPSTKEESPSVEPIEPDKPTDVDTKAEDTTKPEESDNDTAQENQLEIDASKEAEHEAAVQKLSESKKYFLPINAVEQRKSKQFVILGIVVSIILALAWVNIALDASLIKIPGVKPVTHLFSN